ncbi:hypothetical protein, partial [Brucella endophytica]
AGAGTITVTPASTTTLYVGQILMATASVVMTGGATIPDGAQLAMTVSNGIDFIGTGGKTQFVTNISADKTKGYAIFIGVVKSPSLVALNVTGVPATWAGSVVPTPSGPITFTTISTDTLSAQVTGVDNHYVPVAGSDSLTPGSSSYLVTASVQVLDSTKHPVGAGYCVRWKSVSKIGLFVGHMNAYLNKTDTQAIDAQSPAYDQTNDELYTATDIHGVAYVYLVATTKAVPAQLRVIFPGNNFEYAAGNFIVAAPGTLTDTQPDAPISDATVGDGGTVDLKNAAGGTVRVQVPSYSAATDTDYIYVFINQKYQMDFPWSEGMNVTWNGWYNKSDTVNDDETYNILQYIVGTAQGDVYNSIGQAYLVKG